MAVGQGNSIWGGACPTQGKPETGAAAASLFSFLPSDSVLATRSTYRQQTKATWLPAPFLSGHHAPGAVLAVEHSSEKGTALTRGAGRDIKYDQGL